MPSLLRFKSVSPNPSSAQWLVTRLSCAWCMLRGTLHHGSRLMCRDASPGKLGAFEDDLFRNAEMADVPIAAAVVLGYPEGARTIGIAFCDAAGRALGACEYADDEYFCATEAVLVQLGAKEVVLPKACPMPLRFTEYISLTLL